MASAMVRASTVLVASPDGVLPRNGLWACAAITEPVGLTACGPPCCSVEYGRSSEDGALNAGRPWPAAGGIDPVMATRARMNVVSTGPQDVRPRWNCAAATSAERVFLLLPVDQTSSAELVSWLQAISG